VRREPWPRRRHGAATAIEHVGTVTGARSADTHTPLPPPQAAVCDVPLAWFAMAVPSREVAHSAPPGVARRRCLAPWWGRCADGVGPVLDPQMVGEGYCAGRAQAVSASCPTSPAGSHEPVVMAAFEFALPTDGVADAELVAEYAAMAAWRHWGSQHSSATAPCLAGGAAMLPLAAAVSAWCCGGGRG
jgi:hypothetical protein